MRKRVFSYVIHILHRCQSGWFKAVLTRWTLWLPPDSTRMFGRVVPPCVYPTLVIPSWEWGGVGGGHSITIAWCQSKSSFYHGTRDSLQNALSWRILWDQASILSPSSIYNHIPGPARVDPDSIGLWWGNRGCVWDTGCFWGSLSQW